MKFPPPQLRPAAVTLCAGLSDLLGRSVKLQQSRRIWTDPSSGIQTKANIFSIDRGISFQVGRKGPYGGPPDHPPFIYSSPASRSYSGTRWNAQNDRKEC